MQTKINEIVNHIKNNIKYNRIYLCEYVNKHFKQLPYIMLDDQIVIDNYYMGSDLYQLKVDSFKDQVPPIIFFEGTFEECKELTYKLHEALKNVD